MKAYELLAHLNHLTLAGIAEDGLQWIGDSQQWDKVGYQVEAFEMGWPCGDASNHNNGEDDCTLCGVIKMGI